MLSSVSERSAEDIFKVKVLQAMHSWRDAWESVMLSAVANCWKHTGINSVELYELSQGIANFRLESAQFTRLFYSTLPWYSREMIIFKKQCVSAILIIKGDLYTILTPHIRRERPHALFCVFSHKIWHFLWDVRKYNLKSDRVSLPRRSSISIVFPMFASAVQQKY